MGEDRVGAHKIARIVREIVTAVINDGLERPKGTKKGCLTVVQTSQGKTNGKPDPVDGDGLQRMVVEGAVCERYVNIMVHRVNVFWQARSIDVSMRSPKQAYCKAIY